MKCPKCSQALSAQVINNITLDVCDQGCAGIWFDQFEFKKFDEKHEVNPEVILKLKSNTTPSQVSDQPLSCPKCEGMKMMRRFSSVAKKVTVDECPNCAGIWLDTGELADIRNEFDTEGQRQSAAKKVFSQMFDKQLSETRDQSNKQNAQLETLGRALRFISPSFYKNK